LSSFSFNQQEQATAAGIFTRVNRGCKHLRTLTLSCCELSASTIRSIAGVESLKKLNLNMCDGLTDIAVLATMRLERLALYSITDFQSASLQSFVGSNISHTLVEFAISFDDYTTSISNVSAALASCHRLQMLDVKCWEYVFGRNGMDGLQSMATGCPLLADVSLYLTVDGLHYLGTHFTNLKKCDVMYYRRGTWARARTPAGFPSINTLQTLYPAVKWEYQRK
jgi:hypothetical protein